MKNKVKFIPFFLMVLFLGACSVNYRLEVVNYSAQPLTITYKIKEGRQFQNLYVTSVEDWKSLKDPKESKSLMPADAFTTNMEKRERTVTLPPNQVVVLEEGNYHRQREGGMMNTVEIRLSGVNGELNYSGERFYENISQENSAENVFTIVYR